MVRFHYPLQITLHKVWNMAFLKFPIIFGDDDADKKENLGMSLKQTRGVIVINTQAICGYNEMDNKNVLVRMPNGDCWEIPLKLKGFEELLYKTEILVTLSALEEN